jgi:hypothetical protein
VKLSKYRSLFAACIGIAVCAGVRADSISVLLYPQPGVGVLAPGRPFAWTSVSDAQSYELYVGTSAGDKDLLDTGETQATSWVVSRLPTARTLYARIWTRRPEGWRYSDATFQFAGAPSRSVVAAGSRSSRHTILLSPGRAVAARPVFPADGADSVDPSLPFEWTSVPGAAYRLTVGSGKLGSDLYDSGEIRVTKRFVSGLPARFPLNATLWTKLDEQWTSVAFSFRVGAASDPLAAQLAAVAWATHEVRQMADGDNLPAAGTVLAEITAAEGHAGAYCTDYAIALDAVLADMAVALDWRYLNTYMNTNNYDAHTLVEVFHPAQNEWVLFDPTFDMTVRRISDGGYATAADLTRATLARRWSDVVYVALGPEGFQHAQSYYIDYPLLFLNPFSGGGAFVPGRGNSPLPYYEQLPGYATGGAETYAVRAVGVAQVDLLVDGAPTLVTTDGIDQISSAFVAWGVQALPATPSGVQVLRLRRFVF